MPDTGSSAHRCTWSGLCFGIVTFVSVAHGVVETTTALSLTSDDLGVVEGMDEVVDVDPASWSDYLNTLFDPVFDPSVTSNVSAVEGQTAHLVCRVNNLGTKTVSWIRHRDTHILTVGSFTYTSDHRFSALHREGTNEWTLQIRHPTVGDTGLYECQVSTKPIRAYLISLAVVVPKARILHAPELYTNAGGALNLTCVVSPSPAPPEYIFWYHRGQVINYESEGSVEVSVRQEEGRTVSTLLVARAALAHSGHYQCAPSNTDRAEITVHVFKAEEPAAMQTSSGSVVVQQQRPPCCLLLSAALLLRHLLSCEQQETYVQPRQLRRSPCSLLLPAAVAAAAAYLLHQLKSCMEWIT